MRLPDDLSVNKCLQSIGKTYLSRELVDPKFYILDARFVIEFRDVSKSFNPNHPPAVKNMNLEIQSGEFLVLLGESGCGKTTTLKMINRLVEPSTGSIEVDGRSILEKDIIEWRRSVGYVIQRIGLFPHLTIEENILVVPKLLGWSRDRMQSKLSQLFEMIGLEEAQFKDRFPRELSGGQQQRIGVARALAFEPNILLMDEPFGALDPITRDQMQQDLLGIRKKLDLTIVMVTHDMTEALMLADRIAVMSGGEIQQLGSGSELLKNPSNQYVSKLMETPSRHAQIVDELKAG